MSLDSFFDSIRFYFVGLHSVPNFSKMSGKELESYAKKNFDNKKREDSNLSPKNLTNRIFKQKNHNKKQLLRNLFLKNLEVRINELVKQKITTVKIKDYDTIVNGNRRDNIQKSVTELYEISLEIAHIETICDLLKKTGLKREADKISRIEVSINQLNKKVEAALTTVVGDLVYDVENAVSHQALDEHESIMYKLHDYSDYTHTNLTQINDTIKKAHEICKNLSRNPEFKKIDEIVLRANEKWGDEIVAFKKRKQKKWEEDKLKKN